METTRGVIFDIKEFSINDGPGVRQTVFLKGCPLRCEWCHNPEGLEASPQLLVRYGECVHCGLCRAVCRHDTCVACGECVTVCPKRLRSVCGETVTAQELAEKLSKNAGIYAGMQGGITFSGGEPLMQPQFLLETMRLTRGSHRAVETSGYAPRDVFLSVAEEADLIMMDLKLVDPQLHRRYTGVDNTSILSNLALLKQGSTPFIIRIPLIPGVSDSAQNLRDAARMLSGVRSLQYVELLPYNRLAGAKYGMLGKSYEPGFDTQRSLNVDTKLFRDLGIDTVLL